MKYLIALLATALGVAGVVLGEADDPMTRRAFNSSASCSSSARLC
jgi:hypothetical protein